ncbi:uncharacterized protein EMH_0054900 [Eimeria mitis]|uniref:Uncharacterized protein n=1 Tax=Eimeria mitis TaxID=44415 RepID=U6KDS0_9EIME|nr:uncharacterized protein EMH_0054900 [Eimeria mitis]CDJ33633.1 hypothetical protein, conserved [Eimeria mitis]
MDSAVATNGTAVPPPQRPASPSSSQPPAGAAAAGACGSPNSVSVSSNQLSASEDNGNSESCYVVRMGLCAHVRAKNAQAAAAAAADAAAGAATDAEPSDTAKIGSLYISSVPAQQHQPCLEHSPAHDEHQRQHRHQHQQQQQQVTLNSPQRVSGPPPSSFCTIRLENSAAYAADSAATEAVVGAVARAAAAEVSLAAATAGGGSAAAAAAEGIASETSSVSGDPLQSHDGPSRETAAKGVVGIDLPDLEHIPVAVRVPPYGEHLWYELKQLKHFWRWDIHQRDWRQILVCSYFPNIIDPALLTLLRICCCFSVLLLECIASIQGVREVGKAQMLYFTNWNSLLVAAGFLSLTITSVIACISFAAPIQTHHSNPADTQQHQLQRRHQLQQDHHHQQPHQHQQHHEQQHQQQQQQQQLLMNAVEDESCTCSVNCMQTSPPPIASRENSSTSLGFSAAEFVAVDGRHPRPTYSSNKAALLPWLVQQRQYRLQQKQQPRDSRTLCLALHGYRDLMADSRCCVEGILFAPNPSNKSQVCVPTEEAERVPRMQLLRKRRTRSSSSSCNSSSNSNSNSSSSSCCSPRIALPSQTPTVWSSGPTCSTGSRSAAERALSRSVESAPGAVAHAADTADAAVATDADAGRVSQPAATRTTRAAAAGGRGAAAAVVTMPWFVQVTWIVHNLQLVSSLGVAAVFFSLFKAENVDFLGSWITVWKHAALVLLTLLHASLLSRIPCPMRHMGFTIILFICYLTLQLCVYIFQISNGQGGVGYVYRIFYLSEPLQAVTVLFCILFCCFLMHLLLFSISRKRCLYVDPPPSVSVTALQLKRSIRYAAAAAAAAAAAEQIANESSAAAAAANNDAGNKDSVVRLNLQQQQLPLQKQQEHPCCSDQASTGNPDGRQSGSSTERDQQQAQQQVEQQVQ